jgi:hypothetical protein
MIKLESAHCPCAVQSPDYDVRPSVNKLSYDHLIAE